LQTLVQKICKEDKDFGRGEIGKGKKTQVEFISANPTGPLTLGNGRGGFMGDTLANCLEKAGFSVQREYYINNTGNQIKTLGFSVLDVLGVKAAKREDLYRGEYIVEVAKKLQKQIDIQSDNLNTSEVGEKAAKIVFDDFIKPVLTKIKINFDNFVSEKKLHESGKVEAALDLLKKKNLVEEKEGALWFKSKIGLEDKDRVLVRSEFDGERSPTYFLADIAYHLGKFDRGFDKVIDIWGADHAGYVPRIKAAATALGFSDKLDIIIVQLVRLVESGKEIRMSKRTGTFVTLEELVNEVGLDVARFFFISHAANTHMDFDLKLAKERSSKNPVYYVQYAHARCSSILKKAKEEGLETKNLSKVKTSLLDEPSESSLIRVLIKLPELVEDISQSYAVHLLPSYTQEVADSFHKFYEQVRVIDPKNKELTAARLALVSATKIVLANSLDLMGISHPTRMENLSDETNN
jgi:arginyl-tRNA synthetase